MENLTKVCEECNIEKSIDKFGKHHKSMDGYQNICNVCKTGVPEGFKKCSNPECEHPIKLLSEFNKDKNSKFGVKSRCRKCVNKPKEILPEGIKRCTNCNEKKPLSEFHKRKGDELHSKCKICVSEYHKQNYIPAEKGSLLNGTKISPTKIDLTGQKFGNWEVLDYFGFIKGRSMWNCECICGIVKQICSQNLRKGISTSCGCTRRKDGGETGFNLLIHNYIYGAKTRNYKFDLTKAEFKELTQQNCHYCGTKPTTIIHGDYGNWNKDKKEGVMERTKYIYNGVDRKDNNIGYTTENCVPCCGDCNQMKMTMDYNEFIEHNKKICDHMSKIKTNRFFLFN